MGETGDALLQDRSMSATPLGAQVIVVAIRLGAQYVDPQSAPNFSITGETG